VRGEKCIQNFWQEPERKKLVIMPRCCWEGIVKTDQKKIRCWMSTGFTEQGPMTGLYVYGNELSGSIKVGDFD
jgi:hypothetical protein